MVPQWEEMSVGVRRDTWAEGESWAGQRWEASEGK